MCIHIHQLFRTQYTLIYLDTANIYWWWCIIHCNIHTYIYIYIYSCMHIYIYRERERLLIGGGV